MRSLHKRYDAQAIVNYGPKAINYVITSTKNYFTCLCVCLCNVCSVLKFNYAWDSTITIVQLRTGWQLRHLLTRPYLSCWSTDLQPSNISLTLENLIPPAIDRSSNRLKSHEYLYSALNQI